jgi:hypothetical protein
MAVVLLLLCNYVSTGKGRKKKEEKGRKEVKKRSKEMLLIINSCK